MKATPEPLRGPVFPKTMACTVHAVPAKLRSLPTALVVSELGGTPLSIARHSLPRVRREVARLLESEEGEAVTESLDVDTQ